jgi:hypothetical protein
MNDPDDIEALERNLPPRITEVPRPRAVGSPLPMGNGPRAPEPVMEDDAPGITPVAGPIAAENEALDEEDDLADQPSNLQRAVKGVRMALPFVQKILPLLDGQILTAISNVLAPRPPAPPPVDLSPLQDSLTGLQTQHRELRDQIGDHNASLKRVEDRLQMVREATDRNTLEQQEFLEDLKKVNRKSTIIAVVVGTLLAVSIAGNVLLYLHIRGILHW